MICSLNTYTKLSCWPFTWMWPAMLVLGAGFVGTGTKTSGWAFGATSPLSVKRPPPVIVVVALTPLSEAVQELATLVALKDSLPPMPTLSALAELVTDPVAPVVPVELADMADDVKNTAGPAEPEAPSGSVWVTLPPAAGRTTEGLEEAVGFGAHPGGLLFVGGLVQPA